MSHVRWAHRWENFVKNLNVTSQVLVSQTLLPTALWPSVCTSLLPAIRNVGSDARFCMPELTVWAHCLDSLPELTAWADYLSAHLSKPTLRSHSLWIHSISCPRHFHWASPFWSNRLATLKEFAWSPLDLANSILEIPQVILSLHLEVLQSSAEAVKVIRCL